MMPVRFIDLFAGVGGFHIGLERAGNFECVWANEWDKYAASIYRDRFPGTNFNGADIRKIEPEWIPEFDLLVGGFPCQAFSVAGKRRGFDDTRGTMFFEIARILKAKRPRLVLLENVKGLLNHDAGRTFETIISTLDELGYNVEWQVLNSKDFGVPQNRERVFIVGHLRGISSSPIFPLTEIQGIHTEAYEESSNIAQALTATDFKGPSKQRSNIVLEEITSGLGDAQRVYAENGLARTLKGNSGGQGGKTGLYSVAYRTRTLQGLPGRIEQRKDKIANQLTTVPKDSMIVVHNLQPRSPDRPSLKYSHGGSGHLTKQDGSTYCLDSGNAQAIELQGSIRRLTPRECERLQGFPDDWTLNRLVSLKKDMADNQRYKMLGNAVTTNVITAIGKRILEVGA